jgi:hypothetical protein
MPATREDTQDRAIRSTGRRNLGLRTDTHSRQMVCQLICRTVQLTICQLGSRRDDRGR